MRTSMLDQLLLVPQVAGHQHMDELVEISRILDRCPEAAEMVLADLVVGVDPDKGRAGLSGEQVLRAAVVKQLNGYSYEELAFHLADSMSYRAFCRISLDTTKLPSASCLQRNIKKVRPETMVDQPLADRRRAGAGHRRRAKGPNRLHRSRLQHSRPE